MITRITGAEDRYKEFFFGYGEVLQPSRGGVFFPPIFGKSREYADFVPIGVSLAMWGQ